MKKSIFATIVLALFTMFFVASTPKTSDNPPFTVHVSPNGSCNGNVVGAWVVATPNDGPPQSNYTGQNGTVGFSFGVGVSVYVVAYSGGHTGSICSVTQTESGLPDLEICLNDLSCSIEKHNRLLFGCEQIWYN